MISKLKEDDLNKSSRFLKTNDPSKRAKKLDEIKDFLIQGINSEILYEKSFISKEKNSINLFSHVIVKKDASARITNLVFSNKTKEKDLFEITKSCMEYSIKKGAKKLRLRFLLS